MQSVTLKTDNSNWMKSIETAFVTVKSPSGKSIRIKKYGKYSDDEKELIFRCVGQEMVRNYNLSIEVSIEEMKTLLELSKRPNKF